MLDLITIIKEVYSHYLKSVQEQNMSRVKMTVKTDHVYFVHPSTDISVDISTDI